MSGDTQIPPSPRTAPTALRLSDAQVDALTWTEIARAGWRIARLRIVIFPVILGLALLVVALDPAPWRLYLMASVGVLGLLVTIRDYLWLRDLTLEPRHVPYLLSLVVIMQATLIAITGGAESPFLLIMIPMVVLPAMVIGHRRAFVYFMLFPLSVVWLFSAAAVHGWLPDLKPAFWGPGVEFGPNPVYTYTQAAVITFAMILGGAIAVYLRRAVRRGARAAAEARQELLEATQQQNHDLMTLSGEIAHELKNPLASIQGLSGLIARRLPAGSKEAEQMAVLGAEVKRMGKTLDEFLNFSRPVSGLAVRQVHPASLLADVVQMHEGLAHQRDVALRADPGDALPLQCDPRKVKQVLVNLLQNALDATPTGGTVRVRTAHGPGIQGGCPIPPRPEKARFFGAHPQSPRSAPLQEKTPIRCFRQLRSSLKPGSLRSIKDAAEAQATEGSEGDREAGGSGSVRFFIEDTGPGIAPEVADRLFRPGATTKPAGSGLGLVIAQAIAAQHGGAVTLENRPGGGCRAELRLPRRPATPASLNPGDPDATAAGNPDATSAAYRTPRGPQPSAPGAAPVPPEESPDDRA